MDENIWDAFCPVIFIRSQTVTFSRALIWVKCNEQNLMINSWETSAGEGENESFPKPITFHEKQGVAACETLPSLELCKVDLRQSFRRGRGERNR